MMRNAISFNSGNPLLHIMRRDKKIVIWVAIIGSGLAYYFAYGHIADMMR